MVGLLRAVFFFSFSSFGLLKSSAKGKEITAMQFFELTDSRQFHVGFII